jgi:hypothetical protein
LRHLPLQTPRHPGTSLAAVPTPCTRRASLGPMPPPPLDHEQQRPRRRRAQVFPTLWTAATQPATQLVQPVHFDPRYTTLYLPTLPYILGRPDSTRNRTYYFNLWARGHETFETWRGRPEGSGPTTRPIRSLACGPWVRRGRWGRCTLPSRIFWILIDISDAPSRSISPVSPISPRGLFGSRVSDWFNH